MPTTLLYNPARLSLPADVPFSRNDQSLQARGLVGWWPTIGASRGMLRGYAPNQQLLLLSGSPGFSPDPVVGSMLVLDGTTQFASANSGAIPVFQQTTPFSVACWFSTTDTDAGLIGNFNVGTTAGWFMDCNAGSVRLVLANAGVTAGRAVGTTATNLNGGALTHAVVTYNGSSSSAGILIYINGVSVALTGLLNTTPGTLVDNVCAIGIRPGLMAGRIADPRIYNRVLNVAEVAQLFAPQTRWELYSLPKWRIIQTEQRPFGSPDWISIPRISRPAPAHQFPALLQSTLDPGTAPSLPTYDFPLARSSRSPILLGFSDAGNLARVASTPVPGQDLTPRPAPRISSIGTRTQMLNLLPSTLAGQDTFYGAPGQASNLSQALPVRQSRWVDLRSAALNLVALLLSPETPSGQGSAPSRPIAPRRRYPDGQASSVLQLLSAVSPPPIFSSAIASAIPVIRQARLNPGWALPVPPPSETPAGQGSAPARVIARLAVRRHEAGQPSLLSTLLLPVASTPIGSISAEPARRALRLLPPSVALGLAALIAAATPTPSGSIGAEPSRRHWLRVPPASITLSLAALIEAATTQPPFTPAVTSRLPDPWLGRRINLTSTQGPQPQPPQQQFYAPGQVGPWGNFPLRARPYPRGVGGLQLDLQPVWLYLVELVEITYAVAGPAAAGIVYEAVVDALQVRYQAHSDGLDGL